MKGYSKVNMKKRISIIMLLTISVLMTGCEELHKKPLAYIETNADDRQSETSETETKKKKETEPETEAVEVVKQNVRKRRQNLKRKKIKQRMPLRKENFLSWKKQTRLQKKLRWKIFSRIRNFRLGVNLWH